MFEAQQTDMIPLASYKQRNIQLSSEGMKILQKFVSGQIHLIAFEGFRNKEYKITTSLIKSHLAKQNKQDNQIWIRKSPVYNSHARKYIFFIETQIKDIQAKQAFHTLLSLICYAIIVAYQENDQLRYLSTIHPRIHDGSVFRKYMSSQTKQKISQLMCITPNSQNNYKSLEQNPEILLNKLNKQGVENQVISSYPLVKSFTTSLKNLQYSSKQLQQRLLQQIQTVFFTTRSNSSLMYGPILVQYINNIVKQLNKQGRVHLQSAEKQIQIQQAYEAYNQGIKKYHTMGLDLVNMYQHPDIEDLNQSLALAKKSAQQEYFARGGSSNMQYKKLLDDYIEHNEREVSKAYSNQQNRLNIQILQIESKAIMNNIQKNGKQDDVGFINRELQKMRVNYDNQAKGPQKYALYNDYMKQFIPIVYGYKGKISQLQRNIMKHKRLQKKLAQLQKKNGCCAKCSIM